MGEGRRGVKGVRGMRVKGGREVIEDSNLVLLVRARARLEFGPGVRK